MGNVRKSQNECVSYRQNDKELLPRRGKTGVIKIAFAGRYVLWEGWVHGKEFMQFSAGLGKTWLERSRILLDLNENYAHLTPVIVSKWNFQTPKDRN